MRLTLRTLLAWVDAVLPPEEQKQLGEKVGESQVARQLVERIGAVVANDRLGSPRLGAKGLAGDANSVAEYLDNALPPERLESFETICLESDVHLAEVASCHAILAEVARDPSVIQPLDAAGRRALLHSIEHRMKAHPEVLLGGAAAPVPGAKEGRHERAASRGESHAGGVAVTPLAPVAARERRRTPWAAWGTFAASLLLLGVLGLFFARSAGLLQVAPKVQGPRAPEGDVAGAPAEGAAADEAANEPALEAPTEAGAGRDDVAVRDAADGEPSADGDGADASDALADDAAIAAVDPAATMDDATEGPAAGDGAPDEAMPDEVDLADAPPADETVAAADAQAPQGPKKVRAGEALAIAAGVRPAKPVPKAAKAPDADAGVADDVGLEGAAASAGVGVVSAGGVVLVRVVDGDLVRVEPLGGGAPVPAGAELVVPPGMRPEITLGGLPLRLQPRSILRVDVDPDGTPRVEVTEGRVGARAARGDARLAIVAGGLDGRVVAGLDRGVAVESGRLWDRGQGDRKVHTWAMVNAVSQTLEWSAAGSDADAAPSLPPAGVIQWTSFGGVSALKTDDRRPAEWIAGTERLDKLERLAADAFVQRLAALPAGSTPAAGLEQVLDSMAVDRRVENRVFAAVSRALVDDYATAVDLLCAEAPGRKLEPTQWAALERAVVPLAFGRGPASTERLRRAWEDHGPPGKAELLMEMGRGPTTPQLRDGADRVLVDALADGALVVRRYALAALTDITEPSTFDRARFRPDAPEESRREGAAWWRTQLDKGAIVRVRPEPKM